MAKVSKDYTVTIRLNWEEARALKAVLAHVGGDPSGPRGHINQIDDGLANVGLTKHEGLRVSGSIMFN